MESKIKSSHNQLIAESEKYRSEIDSNFESTQSKVNSSVEALILQMRKNTKCLIKWMFIFWIGTVITFLGGLFGFLKLFVNQ